MKEPTYTVRQLIVSMLFMLLFGAYVGAIIGASKACNSVGMYGVKIGVISYECFNPTL